MTAVGGCVGAVQHIPTEDSCRVILGGLADYGSGAPQILSLASASFGAVGPDASSGRAPLASGGRLLVALDGRVDNRRELIRALGLSSAESERLTDPQLLAAAWDRRGCDSLQHMVGDFALAVFDSHLGQLFLARDPSGQRPLFYGCLPGAAAFASMPSGLLNHPNFRRGWNLDRVAAALLDSPYDSATYFCGIQRVRPGQCVAIGQKHKAWTWWRPSIGRVEPGSSASLADAYRSVLGKAVERRLPNSGPIASHLSSGLDSSAVATTAAMLSDRKVVAFTAAPLSEFTGPVPKGRIADETSLASMTALAHGMEHHVVRGGKLSVDYLRRQARIYQEPARNLINGVWWSQILQSAQTLGAASLLTGSLGNVTLNFGGLPTLAQWLDRGEFVEWSRQARAAAKNREVSWRGILFNSFAPWLPHWAWQQLRRRFLGINQSHTASFVRREIHERVGRSDLVDQPSGDQVDDRLAWIARLDPGMLGKGAVAEAGVIECDPMADRELIEFSLSLPPEAYLDSGVWRPLAHEALSDRVPKRVLASPLRGIQSADWPLRFTPQIALNALEEIASGPAADVFDVDAIGSAIANWPEWRNYDLAVADLYSRKLPIALAMGFFMNEFAPVC